MDGALRILHARDFDVRAQAVVEGSLPDGRGSETTPAGRVRVLEYAARQFTVETDSPAPAFLVTSETAYPGWRAWLDGLESAPVTTDVAFRGLPVPAGRHLVKMQFDPRILWRSAWVSAAAIIALALALWFGDNSQVTSQWTSKTN
jgi:hypothetical protein